MKERFLFVFSRSRRPSIDQSLIQTLLSPSSKSILFGTFSNSVNEVHQIKCLKSIVNYLCCTYNSIVNKEEMFECKFIPEMFSTYLSRCKYNGINLSEKYLKSLFITCVSQRESQMQQSFQLHHNLGCAGNHMHKFSK